MDFILFGLPSCVYCEYFVDPQMTFDVKLFFLNLLDSQPSTLLENIGTIEMKFTDCLID